MNTSIKKPFYSLLHVSLLVACFSLTGKSVAEPGSLDRSFNPSASYSLIGNTGSVGAIAFQRDGKVIIGGAFQQLHLARLNPDGGIDPTFNVGNGVEAINEPGRGSPSVFALAVQEDGKILVGGYFNRVNGVERWKVARLNTDGSVDSAFVGVGGLLNSVLAVAIDPLGRILVGGNFDRGGYPRGILRLTTNGSYDLDFDPGAGTDRDVYAIAVQNDRKVLIGGNFSKFKTRDRNRIARLTPEAALDPSFTSPFRDDGFVTSIVVQPDGKILVGGYLQLLNRRDAVSVVRLNVDGTPDRCFTPFFSGSGASSLNLDRDGMIIIGGPFVLRLYPDGDLDSTFVPPIDVGQVLCSAVQPDGNLLAGGAVSSIGSVLHPGVIGLVGGASTNLGPVRLKTPCWTADQGAMLKVIGETNRAFSVHASTDLVEWTDWTNGISAFPMATFFDQQATSIPYRFYRLTVP